MRRGPDERHPDNVDDADVVVQIGDAKTGLRAAHLVGANIRISRSPGFEALEASHTFPKPPTPKTKRWKLCPRCRTLSLLMDNS